MANEVWTHGTGRRMVHPDAALLKASDRGTCPACWSGAEARITPAKDPKQASKAAAAAGSAAAAAEAAGKKIGKSCFSIVFSMNPWPKPV